MVALDSYTSRHSISALVRHQDLVLEDGLTIIKNAPVVELVDTRDSKSRSARSASSILARGTKKHIKNSFC